MSRLSDDYGVTYDWDGELTETTLVTVTQPGMQPVQHRLSQLIAMTNGAVLDILPAPGSRAVE